MSRFGFFFGSSILVVSIAFGACSNIAEDCENTGTCQSAGATSDAGTTSGGEGGTATGGNPSAGNSNAGEGGNPAGGAAAGAAGSPAAGEAGAGGGGALPCDGTCAAPTPVCDEASETCVECLQEADCATDAKNKCDPEAKSCVACLESTDCSTAAAAKCDRGACVECTSNADCAHIAGKGICDAGTCVQCTVADEEVCAGNSCNPATKACTTTEVGSASTCKPCVADSECTGGNQADPEARCVPMEFQGSPRFSGYCLRRAAKTCRRPYTIAISTRSLSGAAAEKYCGIDQQNVTCEAVIDVEDSRTCLAQSDSACGCIRDAENKCVGAGQGGLCRDFAVLQGQCTYQCGTANQCPEGLSCTGSPTKYCQ